MGTTFTKEKLAVHNLQLSSSTVVTTSLVGFLKVLGIIDSKHKLYQSRYVCYHDGFCLKLKGTHIKRSLIEKRH